MKKLELATSRQAVHSLNWSRNHLLTLRKNAQNKSKQNMTNRQSLRLQKYQSSRILTQIQQTITSTSQNCGDYISRLQQQRLKNILLTRLVDHYQTSILDQKNEDSLNKMNKSYINNDYQQVQLRLKQMQKIIQFETNRMNSSKCDTMNMFNLVKAQRRQRVVFSQQFNQVQTQMFNLQAHYKLLLLQRVLLQKNYQVQIKQYILAQQNQSKNIQEICKKNQQKKFNSMSTKKFKDEFSYLKDQQLTIYRSRGKFGNTKMQKMYNNFDELDQNEKQIQNIKKMKQIQQIYNDLHINSLDQLKSTCQNINQTNKQNIQVISNLQDQIYQIGEQVNDYQLQKLRNFPQRRLTSQQLQQVKSKQILNNLIKSSNQKINETKQQIQSFIKSDHLKVLLNINNGNHPTIKSQDYDTIQFLQLIQKGLNTNMQQLLSKQSNSRKKSTKKRIFESSQKNIQSNQQKMYPLLINSHLNKKQKISSSKKISMKYLSNMLKVQQKIKSPTDIISKQQMIKQSLKAFDAIGLTTLDNFSVQYY